MQSDSKVICRKGQRPIRTVEPATYEHMVEVERQKTKKQKQHKQYWEQAKQSMQVYNCCNNNNNSNINRRTEQRQKLTTSDAAMAHCRHLEQACRYANSAIHIYIDIYVNKYVYKCACIYEYLSTYVC